MLNKHINFLSLLLLALFAFPKSNALPIKDVYSLCKESGVVDFCLEQIGSNKYIVDARDFNDVFLIAISKFQIWVDIGVHESRSDHFRKVYSDPIRKPWLAVCEKKYEIASNNVNKAWEVGQKKSKSLTDRTQMSQLTEAGFEAVLDCDDEWTKDINHSQVSPFVFWYHDVRNLIKIIRVIIRRLNA
ncbi:Pectinesterase inhibitor domain [Arabidopsis suecica]|uniref:Pectinesterase inhibitor domain n=1 Tax=Arabidopsis suecica TaxID=45249 RepID=A0A8T2AMM2_ARASU|nr:Pectinesterase inhibitor domain [Arabidopsis suecica]